MREAVALVPSGASVMTNANRLGAHLSARRTIQLFPTETYVEWAVVDMWDPWLQIGGEEEDAELFSHLPRRFRADGAWQLAERTHRGRPGVQEDSVSSDIAHTGRGGAAQVLRTTRREGGACKLRVASRTPSNAPYLVAFGIAGLLAFEVALEKRGRGMACLPLRRRT